MSYRYPSPSLLTLQTLDGEMPPTHLLGVANLLAPSQSSVYLWPQLPQDLQWWVQNGHTVFQREGHCLPGACGTRSHRRKDPAEGT